MAEEATQLRTELLQRWVQWRDRTQSTGSDRDISRFLDQLLYFEPEFLRYEITPGHMSRENAFLAISMFQHDLGRLRRRIA